MRKILLATTAFVGVALAGSAHAAATSPIALNVGGYDDFVAGWFHEAQGTSQSGRRASHDFENEYKINFDATGKGSNGIEYGANVSLWNGSEASTLWVAGGTTANINTAYVWLSGAFGKVLMGDEHGASDLFVYAPTVGEGQFDGRWRDFVDAHTLAYIQASGIDNTEHSTKVTYYTPKVGSENHKVQVGISYIPNMYDYGQNVVNYQGGNNVSAYQDLIKGALQYTGNLHPVNVTGSLQIITGSHTSHALGLTTLGGGTAGIANGSHIGTTATAKDFTAYALGMQAAYNGATFGASYADNGRYNTIAGQKKKQEVLTVGAKYEFDKVGVAAQYLNGSAYGNYLTNGTGTSSVGNPNYVSNFNAYSAGAVYTWFPGLTTNADAVFFNQKVKDQADHNDGYTLLLSQRLAF